MVGQNKIIPLSFVLWGWLSLGSPTIPSEPLELSTECSKSEIFVGEQVHCHFVLYSQEEVGEVEVAKFPEFTGYWKENLVLRQGPVVSFFEMIGGKPYRKVIVGSYSLVPMVEEREPKMEPMKLVVRPSLGGAEASETIILSKIPALKIKNLPPFSPLDPNAKLFRGAVGHFTLGATRASVSYKRDEPAQITFTLQGEGNFQEINELGVALPDFVEIVSRRVFQSSGPFAKSFELTLSVHDDRGFTIPEIPFVFFNPTEKRYQKLSAGPVSFVPMPKPAMDDKQDQPEFGPIPPDKSRYRRIFTHPVFWGALALLLCFMLGYIVKRLFRAPEKAPASDPDVGSRINLKDAASVILREAESAMLTDAENALDDGDTEDFLRIADAIVFETLAHALFLKAKDISRTKLLAMAEGKISEELLSNARKIFSAYQRLAFSPDHALAEEPETLRRCLKKVMVE